MSASSTPLAASSTPLVYRHTCDFLIHRGTTGFSQPLAFFLPASGFFRLSYYVFVYSSALCHCKTLFGGSATCLYSKSLLLILSLSSPLHVGEQSMGTFSGVLHLCGHRKVLTWHVPNPYYIVLFEQKITTSFTDYFDTVSVPCLKHTPRLTGRCVHWWLGFPSPP